MFSHEQSGIEYEYEARIVVDIGPSYPQLARGKLLSSEGKLVKRGLARRQALWHRRKKRRWHGYEYVVHRGSTTAATHSSMSLAWLDLQLGSKTAIVINGKKKQGVQDRGSLGSC